ncbi:MAG: MoxR family ATPase, partial [Verrucomicrobiota bacterium]|nr:MoxR family ATPase [Verrucomicrobiota bacterium]
VDYPDDQEEREIIRRVTSPGEGEVKALMNAEEIVQLQEIVKSVPVGDHVIDFAADIARATRPNSGEAPEFVKEMVGWGAGPRAGIALISAAKAHAVLRGRFHATTGDVAAVAPPVLRHRVLTTFHAEASGVTSDSIVEMLLEHLEPKEEIKI